MNRACLAVLALAACSDSAKTPPPQAPPGAARPVPQVMAGPALSPPPPRPPTAEIQPLDDALIDKYLAVEKAVAETMADTAKGAKPPARVPSGAPPEFRQRVTEDLSIMVLGQLESVSHQARVREGIGTVEYGRIAGIVDRVLVERQVFDAWGGESGLARLEAQARKDLDTRLSRLPKEKHGAAMAAAQSDLKKLAEVRATGTAPQTRKVFGDHDVDLVLKRFEEIHQVRETLSASLPRMQ